MKSFKVKNQKINAHISDENIKATNLESNETRTYSESVINLLKEILYNSLAQALIKTFLTPHVILKIFLTLFIIVSSCLSSYLVTQSCLAYLTYGVSTTSRIIHEMPMLFPKVTFCNFNWLTTQYAYNLKTKHSGTFHLYNLSNENKKKLGHDLDDILLECFFNLKPCNSSDFVWSFDEYYGNCFTFNSGLTGSLSRTTIACPDCGLQLKLYVNMYELLIDKIESNGLGALIRIGNSSYSTYYSNNGIFTSPSQDTFIGISRVFQSFLPKPYSSCDLTPSFRLDSFFYNLIKDSEYVYTQQLCFVQCLQNELIRQFNCTHPNVLSLYRNVTICNLSILGSKFDWDNMFDRDFIAEFCLPSCPLECNHTLYRAFITSVQFMGNKFISSIAANPKLALDFIERKIDLTQVEKSIVSVNIYDESLSYTLTTESPQMDLVSLLASIGGNLSLFLGVSAFSFCEVAEVMIEIYFVVKNKRHL
jgi:hypothetical protein